MDTLDVTALAARLAADDPPGLLDVREPEEVELCPFPGAVNVPLALLPLRLAGLDREREWVVICHHGVRSAMAVRYLEEEGFGRVANLVGGVDAWAIRVDPSMPRY